jgi:hypothetical protein
MIFFKKNGTDNAKGKDFIKFAGGNMALAIAGTIALLWLFVTLFGLFEKPQTVQSPAGQVEQKETGDKKNIPSKKTAATDKARNKKSATIHDRNSHTPAGLAPAQLMTAQRAVEKPMETTPPTPEIPAAIRPRPKAVGEAFVQATIQPLYHELNERLWGWRPNDFLNFTDNVNNFQLGVLEVTRRTAVILTENISRTGTTASFDPNLEQAMNWFMIKADRYWFPSAESKYNAGLKEMEGYQKKLEQHQANFYTRPDNLIPLLKAYENLMGSCDQNLVKQKEEDGSKVSSFKADDYLYYAKGVASAMGAILSAIQEDFHLTLESRRGVEILHHAIESCHHATQINPWIVLESDLSGIFANHRANMATSISHARFYIGVLITILST